MRHRFFVVGALLAVLTLLNACGGDDGNGNAPTATRTGAAASATRTAVTPLPTATATLRASTPTGTAAPFNTIPATSTATPLGGAGVAGLVVLRGDFRAGAGEALGAPPSEWSDKPGAESFDRALSYATWKLVGPVERSGDTAADGRFSIGDLPPGNYRLELSKTLDGNLVGAIVAFTAGDGGRAELVIEIAQGQIRSTNTYRDAGVAVRETTAPNGSRLVTRDSRIAELGASGRHYVDADGDGVFDSGECNGSASLWLCNAQRECGPERSCTCLASCPGCEDCPLTVCAPANSTPLHRCTDGGSCDAAGGQCACVSSCPECDDCAASACVAATCDPASIASISVSGPSSLFVGQQGYANASARLTDGWVVDVTQLVDWASSDASIVAVDPWGGLSALALGTANVSASLAEHQSDPWPIQVAARPALVRLHLQNASCYYPYAMPDVGPGGASPRPLPSDVFVPPNCRQVVRLGGTLQFFVLGEFQNGYYEDVTAQVGWELSPEGLGEIKRGAFTAAEVGTGSLRATLEEIRSEPIEIKVVDRPTIVALQVYPLAAVTRPGPFPPERPNDAPIPCYDCGYAVTILRGDELPFQATAAYDTGEWEDVSARVTWSSSNSSAAPISTPGVLTAVAGGETSVSAALGDATSNAVQVRVVESATLLTLSAYQEGYDRVVAKGEEAFFHAVGYYDVGFDRDVTTTATWKSSNDAVGGFDRPGVFIGRSAGNVEVWVELDGVQSNRLPIEVFQTSSLGYCDDNAINRSEWSDAFNRVVLESDCGLYTHPDVATLRFTVTERERPNGIFDPCLDLHVYQGDRLVRTIREEGCGKPFLAPGAPEFDQAAARYQTLAFWDLKDDRGSPVPPGTYTVRGRFYLYYDPIVELNIVVSAPNGRIPCTPNACGNGCGYVHACGDDGPSTGCPTVCTQICECPLGWGITAEGDCEPCAEECCPSGAACLPGTPSCEPPPVCCPAGMACIPELPPCTERCCPFGAMCGPLDLPPCDCCPAGAACVDPAFAPCEPPPRCCPKDAICILPLPTCEEDCCPTGTQCTGDLVPCDELMCCRPDGSCLPMQPPCK